MDEIDGDSDSGSFEDGSDVSPGRVGAGGKRKRKSKDRRMSKQGTNVTNNLNEDSKFLNQNSSTAMGTNQHG